jgi:hypothetical protein
MNSHRDHMLAFYRRELAAARLERFPTVPLERWHLYDVLSGKPWAWYVRLTFRHLPTSSVARTRWAQWIRDINWWQFDCHRPLKVSWALSAELQSRRVVCYRAVLGDVLDKTEWFAIRQWECAANGDITIIPYDRSRLEVFIAKGDRIEFSDPSLSPK